MRFTRFLVVLGTAALPALGACAPEAETDDQPHTQQEGGLLEAGAGPDTGSGGGTDTGTADAGAVVDAARPSDAGVPREAAVGLDASNPADSGSPRQDANVTQPDAASGEAGTNLPKFSFFVTSLSAMRALSKSPNGFGGDLRFGETGEGAGLRGADKICAAAAELGMPGASAKQWRAFLSTTAVAGRSRIGTGPWYDRMGRLVAMNLTGLFQERPEGAHASIRDDLPNERGEPNRAGSAEGMNDDNHDVVTGSTATGEPAGGNTCEDWTSTTATGGGGGGGGGGPGRGPQIGHSWPAQSGRSWAMTHRAPGCSPSVSLVQTGAGSGTGIGNGGGYGGIYCFALTP